MGLESIGCSYLNRYVYVHNKCLVTDQEEITKVKHPVLCLDLTFRFPYTPPRERHSIRPAMTAEEVFLYG